MGKIIHTSTNALRPSQDFLKEGTLQYIFDCIERGVEEDLPPTPIVRKDPDSEGYIAIDGHNLIAVRDALGQRMDVHVADSPDDTFEDAHADSEALAARNRDLADKFDSALNESRRLAEIGMNTFADLRKKYPDIFSESE